MFKRRYFLFVLLFFTVSLNGGEIEGARPEPSRTYANEEFKLVMKPPIGNYDFYSRAVFFHFPGALCEYSNNNTGVTYTLFALRTIRSASYIGEYLRFHITGRASQVEVIEDGVWMLKRNALTLQQLYQFFIKNRLFFMTVFIMQHKQDEERKAALLVACPFERFKWIKEHAYQAYLEFNFTD